MSIRTFIFCDFCNPEWIRVIEHRRSHVRLLHDSYGSSGRRIIDGRSWFDGDLEEAKVAGWRIDEENHHVCPKCVARGFGVFTP